MNRCVAPLLALSLLAIGSAAVAQSSSATKPLVCSAIITRKFQSISYAPRTDAQLLAELQSELTYWRRESAQFEVALKSAQAAGRQLGPNYHADILAAGVTLEAALSAGGPSGRGGARVDYERLVRGHFERQRAADLNHHRQYFAPLLPDGPHVPPKSLPQSKQVTQAAWLRDEAEFVYQDLQLAERLERLKLDILPAGTPGRAAIERAYYDAVVAQLPALQKLEAANFAWAREANVKPMGMTYSLSKLNCSA